jgi:hypothetical protein
LLITLHQQKFHFIKHHIVKKNRFKNMVLLIFFT